MTALERHQVPIYFTAVLLGAVVGLLLPGSASGLESLIWPVVGTLLYFTFLQVPLLQFRQALADVRFLAAMLTANFVFVPLVVWLLLKVLPPSPPIQLGVALVLLTPCTDWMNTFTLLGKGDAHRTLAATPLLLVTQILLLPLFLWLMLESDTSQMVATRPFLQAFFGLIVLPLSLAWLTEWCGKRNEWVGHAIARSTALPVVLLAITILVIAASQIQQVLSDARQLTLVTLVFVAYVALAAVVGRVTVRLYSLSPRQGRGVIFSTGTRNSFVVLPLALALPPEWNLAVAVIVIQAFVEMLGMLTFIRVVPGWLLRDAEWGDKTN
ncbi:MAG: arsenic resistance protein [Candidatus Paceibacterota bacterium]